jgi:hypothetical protein
MSNQTAEMSAAAAAKGLYEVQYEAPREVSREASGGEASAELPEQLIALPGGRWAMWRCVALRGAGFPASEVLRLSSPECGAAADRLAAEEEAAGRARVRALEATEAAIGGIRAAGVWAESATREPLLRALKKLKFDKCPQGQTGEPAVDALVEEFRAAREAAEEARREFQRSYAEATARASEEIRGVMDGRLFREAVTWQNRHAFNRVARTLSRKTAGARNSNQRRDEELIASYLQRYAVKNDTIGFFGPVGWAKLTPEGEAVDTRPGPALVESRSVFLESWGIKALAEVVASNEEVLKWVAPRRVPYVHVEGNALHLPGARPSMLTPRQAAVLRACDGERLACEIAEMLRSDAKLGFKTDEDVYKVVETLHARGLVIRDFVLPLAIGSEKHLRRMFERIGPAELREPAIAALDELEAARDVVAAAAGDPEQLDRALGALEETFTRLTDIASTRAHGQMYAARTLVYEDCRRGIEVSLGPDVLETLGPPLSLLLTSSRWVSYTIAEIYEGAVREVYEKLAHKAGSKVIEAATLWAHIQPLIFSESHELPIKELEPLLQERWARILSLPEGARRVHYTAEELRASVGREFEAPRPGWMSARQHSPDLMIAAEGVEAIQRGEYLLTIGELHLATNTVGAASFMSQHPAPEELVRAVEHDFPEPRPLPVKPASWPNSNVRTCIALSSPKDLHVEFAHDSILPGAPNVLRIADLLAEDVDGTLMMRTRDGRTSFPVLEAIGEGLSSVAVNAMKMLAPARHNPRVTVDRLVIARESWSFGREEFDFAHVEDEAERFLAARAWAKTHGMPRFVFVKVPTETKPFYLDFDSPLYVDILSKLIRQMEGRPKSEAMITVSEMLPTPDQTWLPDAEGNRYTSELRMVAVDLDHVV